MHGWGGVREMETRSYLSSGGISVRFHNRITLDFSLEAEPRPRRHRDRGRWSVSRGARLLNANEVPPGNVRRTITDGKISRRARSERDRRGERFRKKVGSGREDLRWRKNKKKSISFIAFN